MASRSVALAASFLLLGLVSAAPGQVGVATVSGPVTGGTTNAPFVASTSFDLAPLGYVEEEFFLSGTASSFTSATPLTSDGRWTVSPDRTAPYTTRILVRKPARPRKFNGTVVVEWLNVSGGVDAGPDWILTHTLLMREGYAWVGVTAQAGGISGSGGPLGINLTLKAVDPVRYEPLDHPGDDFSYDIFSQVAEAIRRPAGTRPLGDLKVKRVLAVGESQSAFRLVTYVNGIHPVAQAYDAYLIHSRGGGGTPLAPGVSAPGVTFLREDIGVPVLTFQTETDMVALGFFPARQADTEWHRLWEVAGTAHADSYQVGVGMTDQGRAALDTTHLPPTNQAAGGVITCGTPINSGPQHYVLSAAVSQLDRWVRTGKAARIAPRLEIAAGVPPVIARDEHGNAHGGIRTPQLDVPVQTLSGLGQTGTAFCSLFGTMVPFDAATLAALYPTHGAYVKAVRKAAKAAVRGGWILKIDAKPIVAAAVASDVGK